MKANWYNNKKLRKGFTLVELIIVMVIIGILGVVVASKFGDSTDDAKYTKELSTITNLKDSISATNAKSRIFDILATGAGQDITAKLDKKMEGLTYYIASTVIGNKSAQSLVGFGTDDASKSRIKTLVTSLEDVYDITPSGSAGIFQYDATCATGTTDGSDCYYMVYLDGNVLSSEAWEPTIGGSGLTSSTTTSVATAAQTFVKLN